MAGFSIILTDFAALALFLLAGFCLIVGLGALTGSSSLSGEGEGVILVCLTGGGNIEGWDTVSKLGSSLSNNSA